MYILKGHVYSVDDVDFVSWAIIFCFQTIILNFDRQLLYYIRIS